MAFLALFGLLATLSVVQAAVPAIFSLNTNIGDAQPTDIAYDAFGNSYYLSNDVALDSNNIVAVHPDGSKFSGCPSSSTLQTQLAGILPNSKIAGFTHLADRNFPAAPSAASWLFVTLCDPTLCLLVRVPVANAPTTTGPSCPINWAGAFTLGPIQGTFNSLTVTCNRYTTTSFVSMTANPSTGALYIGCTATVAGQVSSYIIQTQNMQTNAGVFLGTFAAFNAASNVAYRITAATSVIGSMTVDTYGSLWALDTARSMLFAMKPFTTDRKSVV